MTPRPTAPVAKAKGPKTSVVISPLARGVLPVTAAAALLDALTR